MIYFIHLVDLQHADHPLLYSYVDPVCIEPGRDHEDAVGTEMRQFSLYDEKISTPEKFKNVLQNER